MTFKTAMHGTIAALIATVVADQFCNAVEIGFALTTLAERTKASGTRMVSGSKVVSRKVDGMKG
jgi:hypothetical protein